MKFVDTGDPDVIHIQNRTHGCLILFGLPFLMAGLVFIGSSLGIVPIKSHPPVYFEVPFGLLMAAAGALLMFGRYGIIIDRRHKVISRWYGLIAPIKTIKTFFDNYNLVALLKETRKDSTSFDISLEGDKVSPLNLDSFADYQQARQFAENIAKFITLPFADRSSGKEIIRDWDKLDESVRDRARRTGEKLDVGTVPMNMRSRVMEHIGSVTIEIPPSGGLVPILYVLHVIFPMIFVTLLARFFIYPMLNMLIPDEFKYIVPAIICAAIISLTALVSYRKARQKAYKTCIITASKEALIIVEKSGGATTVTQIPAAEIEELELPEFHLGPALIKTLDGKLTLDPNTPIPTPNGSTYKPGPRMLSFLTFIIRIFPQKGITARSNKVSVEFAQGLDKDEIEYIYALIKKTLIG